MKKSILIIVSSIFFTCSINAQSNIGGVIQNSVNSIAPKSPDAAALFKYAETPVSLYTGVPDINIPLYTIKEGDIELPISISYHAGGIKVNDEASSVGLGWSLNAGGRVSQIISGVSDFTLYGYYNTYPQNISGYSQPVSVGCRFLSWNKNTQSNAYYTNNLSSYFDNQKPWNYIGLDTQPDLFLINIPGKNYKAYLDMTKTIKPNGPIKFAIAEQPNVDFKLIGTVGAMGGYNFQLTDEQGINYQFDQQEITTPLTGTYYISGYSNLLSKIQDVKGNNITFSYSQAITNSRISGCKNTRIAMLLSQTFPGTFTNISENLGDTKVTENGLTDCSKQSVQERYLQSISFANGSIQFDWADREDINNSKKLTSIKIKDNNGGIIKQYNFNYDYFVATDNMDTNSMVTWLGASDNKIFTHRLKLINLTESVANEKYSFNYNSTYNLPNKLSFSSDFWGYYNGQNNSDTFIPDPNKYIRGENIFNVTSFNNDDNGYFYNASYAPQGFNGNNAGVTIYKNYSSNGKHYLSDRRASLYSLAGMLTAITYPTGGITEFEYEPNTFSNFPMQSLINDNTNQLVGTGASINNINGNIVHNNNPQTFTIAGSNIKVSISAHFGFYYFSSATNNVKNSYWVYIKNLADGSTIKKLFNSNVGSFQTTFVMDDIILQSGTYQVGFSYNNDFDFGQIYTSGSNGVLSSAQIKYTQEKSVINGIEHNYSSGGGIRIKSIKSTEKPGASPLIKNFIYDDIINNGAKITSNGNLAEFPKFYEIGNRCFRRTDIEVVYAWTPPNNHSTSISPDPNCNLSNGGFNISVYEGIPTTGSSSLPQGGLVGYSKVIEKIIGKGETETYFFNGYNQSCINLMTKGHSLIIGNGDLLKQNTYDNNKSLIKEITYNYKQNYSDGLNTYFISATNIEPISRFIDQPFAVFPDYMGVTPLISSYGGIIHTYTISLYKSLLDNTTTKEYFPAGSSNYVETKTFTTYNNKYLAKIQKTTYPDNSYIETTHNYAQEKGNQLMIDKNMVGIPLETTTTRTVGGTTKTLSKTETIYPTSLPTAQTGNLVLPTSVLSYDLQNPTSSTTEVTYDKYDSKGNLQQYTTKDGISTAIIWGYNNTQPIAKVVGATYAQVSSLATAIISASDTDASAVPNNDETAILTALDNFRKDSSMAGYQVTTYTYDPLIGVRSITPPSGIREVYLYDTAHRLMEIREGSQTGKLLKEFKYNYKN
jgi:hypothetical protein